MLPLISSGKTDDDLPQQRQVPQIHPQNAQLWSALPMLHPSPRVQPPFEKYGTASAPGDGVKTSASCDGLWNLRGGQDMDMVFDTGGPYPLLLHTAFALAYS